MKNTQRLIAFGITFVTSLGAQSAAAHPSEALPPPCEAAECAQSCINFAQTFADPGQQPIKPPSDGIPRCIEVSLPSAADPCEYETHAACDCDSTPVPEGTQVSQTGLPQFAFVGDAPAGTCVREGRLPNSCLLRGEETKCKIGGDGMDCAAACELLKTRIDADTARSAGVTVDGSECASKEACACVLKLDGECTFAGEPVACGISPKSAYDTWLEKERATATDGICQDGCSCAAVGEPRKGMDVGALLGAVGMVVGAWRVWGRRRAWQG